MKINSFSFSGFGGSYEDTCQKMVWQGVKFLVENPDLVPEFKTFRNVYGLAIPQNEAGKQLEIAIVKGHDDCTGAMFQCAVGHIQYIAENGYDKWYAEMKMHRKDKDEYIMEFEADFKLPKEKIFKD